VEVKDGDKWARLDPYDGYRLSFSIEFRHPVIERTTQAVTVDFAETSYLKEIARARTFGFMHEVEDLRDSGLALGGGLDNAVVLDEYRVLNSDGLRFADEFIRHKLLDAIGDLYLLGALGAFTAHKSIRTQSPGACPRMTLRRWNRWSSSAGFQGRAARPAQQGAVARIMARGRDRARLLVLAGRGRHPEVAARLADLQIRDFRARVCAGAVRRRGAPDGGFAPGGERRCSACRAGESPILLGLPGIDACGKCDARNNRRADAFGCTLLKLN
jgi:hypothetical protein